jgi:hypothetical protein
VSSIEEAERIYAVLADGSQILMPMQETFFAFRFGMVRDRFGTSWMIFNERPAPQANQSFSPGFSLRLGVSAGETSASTVSETQSTRQGHPI